ncbi:hypothetical protein [uncultured Hydrogenophaga sp.]|nr:hypothetical protein [uncultured Hydrogenophaga sp.]
MNLIRIQSRCAQNACDKLYQAALDLVFKGKESPAATPSRCCTPGV